MGAAVVRWVAMMLRVANVLGCARDRCAFLTQHSGAAVVSTAVFGEAGSWLSPGTVLRLPCVRAPSNLRCLCLLARPDPFAPHNSVLTNTRC